MKNKFILSVIILIILVSGVTSLTGNVHNVNSNVKMPAIIIKNDTIPVVTLPAIIIVGSSK